MARTLWQSFAACALVSTLAACSGAKSDVRPTAFEADSGRTTGVAVAFDQDVRWACGDANLQAVFTSSFTGDALVAAIKSAIADPKKADAAFSFVAPIDSFSTAFNERALCMTISADKSAPETAALVAQLRATGNVESVRTN
jgi:hypothetical protein